MEQLNINIKGEGIKVLIGSSITDEILQIVNKNHKGHKVAVITDSKLEKLCQPLLNSLNSLKPLLISVLPGEKSKSRETKAKIEDQILDNKFGRDSVIIALGGGVIGDLAGYVASTLNRGVPLIHVPTTLLAMVDSSIGGKTGVNTKHGKNLIGTIYQPDAIISDLDFLKTLLEKEFKNGLAEIVKIAATSDPKLLSYIEKHVKNIENRDTNTLLHIIKRAVQLKIDVIEKDTEETGLRQILNFGHTIGHALEVGSKYEGMHGHFVSQGIIVETRIAQLMGILNETDVHRIKSLLKTLNLPTKIEKNITLEKIYGHMVSDKKTRNQKPRFVLLENIGKIKHGRGYSFEVKENVIEKAIGLCKDD